MRSSRALATVFLAGLFGVTVLAQQSGQSDQDRERQRLQLQAISTIRQVATEAPLWNDKEAAVFALSDAADVLWDEDPPQSVKWLRKAWERADQVSSAPRNEKLKAYFTTSAQSELRTKVLAIARKHDPKLAEEFLKQASEKEANDKKERGAFDDRTARSEQLLSMAQQVLDSNPEEAFALAESSLADGLSYKLQNILASLRKKDVQLANRLFDLALARFNSRAPDPSEALILTGYLFQPGLTFSANSAGGKMLVVVPSDQDFAIVAASEPQRTKNFLIAVYERLLAPPIALDSPEGQLRAQRILVLGNLVGRRYASFAPDLAPAAQGFLAQLRGRLMSDGETVSVSGGSRTSSPSEDSTKRLTKEELYEKTIIELEDSAAKENNALFRNVAYVNAALITSPEDYARAKRIAEKIDDNDLRADAVSFVLYRAALALVEKNEVERANEIAPQISNATRRAVVRIAIAQRLLAPKTERMEQGVLRLEQQRAFDLLTEIETDLKKSEPSPNVAKILLARTSVLAELDPAQALLALDQAVNEINKLDGFDLHDGAAPDLGLGVSAVSGATVARPRIGFDLRSAIDQLVVIDFEQVSAVVERFTAKNVRGVGRLEVAKLFLKKSKFAGPSKSSPPAMVGSGVASGR